ncbi:MAG: CHASE2 domain-containing protein [Bdellovibrionales bacterium]|nr:CHASE2 domain-containing protein [Bdellovibrionales bacterium]
MDFKVLSIKLSKNSSFVFFLRVILALIIAFAMNQLDLQNWESFTYDLRVRTTPSTPVSGNVKTIEINADDVATLKGEPHLALHIQLLKQLKLAHPHAVIYLLNYQHLQGSEKEWKEFGDLARSFKHFILTTNELKAQGQEKELELTTGPLKGLRLEMGLTTKDDNNFAKDFVTRRLIIANFNEPFFQHKIAKDFNFIKDFHDYQGAFNYYSSTQSYVDFRPTGTYKATPFMDFFSPHKVDLKDFSDKIVLIGRNTMTEADDYISTPFSRENTAMSKLELQANIFDTLILNSSPIQPSKWLTYLLTIVISIFIVFTVFSLPPLKGLLILMSTLFTFILFAWFSFFALDMIVEVVPVLLSIFLSYYFFIPYRLIMENKKSWEYQQKNKLLKTVEELKTNFMRMMSHDLKTPLARIQGMTEVAINDPTPLSLKQKEALKNINSSSRELSEFITSILDLSRVESNEVKLKLKSKDLNSVVSDIVEKFRYLAKEKNIHLKLELEPLFSIKIDEDLIKQVFTNLIENAIKYSPNGSNVLITSEEVEGRIFVQVADQGQGISLEDQRHVFEKFFRSTNAQASNIMGSGLGLYLSKYFVELHNGKISLESEINQGSTFTVELPMEGL